MSTRTTLKIAVAAQCLLLSSCGLFKKDNGGDGATVNPTDGSEKSLSGNDYEDYSTERFAGTRDEALAIAGRLMLDSNINLIKTENDGSTGLRLQFGGDLTYDQMMTHTYVYDPSLSLLKQVRSLLCILAKLEYDTIPETAQTVSTQIKECLPRAASKGNKSSGSGGSSGSSSSGSSGSSGSSSSSSKEDLGLADITWESFVNVDEQLIVLFKYTENAAQEWMPPMEKEITFVIQEGASESNPFGSYYLKIRGFADWSKTSGGAAFAMRSSSYDVRKANRYNLTTFGLQDDYADLQAKMVVDSSENLGLGDGEVYLTYQEENRSFGNSKRMSGLFEIDKTAGVAGLIKQGQYIADIEGWDEESGEPGGYFRVAFNQTNLLREKSIPDLKEYFGDSFEGTIVNSEPVKECFKSNSFSTWVHGYRLFKEDGSALDQKNQGFSFATGSGESALQGYASYWGVDVFSQDGSPVDVSTVGTVYKVDWSQFNEDGTPSLGESYTLQSKPGRLTKQTRSAYDLNKLHGKKIEGYSQYDEASGNYYSYKIEYDKDQGVFYKVQRMSNDYTSGEMPTWESVTREAITFNEGDTYYLWSPSFTSGSVVLSYADSQLSARVEEWQTVTGSHDTLTLKCYSQCPKPGITYEAIQQVYEDWSYYDQIYSSVWEASTAVTFTINDFTLYRDNSPITLDFSSATADSWAALSMYDLIEQSAWNTVLSANPSADPYTIRQQVNTVYSYEMGPSSWQKTIILRDASGNTVTFDPPRKFDITLTAENERFGDTSRLGESFSAQADSGFLWLPMEAVGTQTDPITGMEWEMWAPVFALKDGTILTDANDGSRYKVKAEFVEKRMNTDSLDACSALQLPSTLSLPEKEEL